MSLAPRSLPPSLYAETAIPSVAAPPLQGGKTVSVAIVGGGFTGLSTALHLAERGTDVAVLEAHEPGWGASGRNGGQVNPGLKLDPSSVERDFGPDLGGRMVRMSWNAPQFVFDLVQRHQIQCEALQSGTIRAATNEATARDVEVSFAQASQRGMPVEMLDASRLQTETGTSRYRAALLDRSGGHLNPLSYARGLAQAAMQAGAAVHGGTPATRIARNGRQWVVATPTGSLRADRIVLATNGYTDGLWPNLRRTVVPVFSGIAATEPLAPDVAAAIMPIRSALYELGNITVYYRLDAQNRLLMGGRSRQAELARPTDLAYLIRYSERLWPALRGVRWTHGWSGQLAMTTDHYPHVHEPAPGVLACLGYNGRGVAMASAMGHQIARHILGGALDMPVTDMRTIPVHGFWKLGVQARIAYGRIRDAIGL